MALGITSIIIGYLLGSIPVAYIIARRRKGIDIRDVGVRNMGGANVIREVGVWAGTVTLICDIGKGALSVYIAQLMGVSLPWVLGAGLTAMLGHNFPIYIGFRGGKGVATLIGVFLVLSPLGMFSALVIIGIALLITRYFFVAIAITSPLFLVCIWYVEGVGPIFFLAIAVVIFQLYRNRGRLREVKPGLQKLRKTKKTDRGIQ